MKQTILYRETKIHGYETIEIKELTGKDIIRFTHYDKNNKVKRQHTYKQNHDEHVKYLIDSGWLIKKSN